MSLFWPTLYCSREDNVSHTSGLGLVTYLEEGLVEGGVVGRDSTDVIGRVSRVATSITVGSRTLAVVKVVVIVRLLGPGGDQLSDVDVEHTFLLV